MGLFALVSEQKFSTMETARLFSAASQYGQNQRLIREFLDSDDEVAREILSLMNVSTSSRLHPVEQMGYKFQELDLGWTRPLYITVNTVNCGLFISLTDNNLIDGLRATANTNRGSLGQQLASQTMADPNCRQ